MTIESINYQCPNCGAPLKYDVHSDALTCGNCSSAFSVEDIKVIYESKEKTTETGNDNTHNRKNFGDNASDIDELVTEAKQATVDNNTVHDNPIQSFLKRASWNEAERAGMRSYTCESCGASLTVDATTAVQECPYCGNQSVIPGVLDDSARPDSVIPFRIDKQQAIESLASYYKGKKFLPKAFASGNKVSHVQGVYVPFWLYDGTASGSGTFNATISNTMHQGDYMVTVTRYYQAHRSGNVSMQRVPADGSAKMPDGHMDAIEPYDYSDLRPFDIGYMPGYVAERFDENADECRTRTDERMEQTLADELRATVTGYTTVDRGHVSSSIEHSKTEYAMLPVWMLHTRWHDDDYLFAMNGQTGKMVGDLPVSVPKVIAWFTGLLIAFIAAMIGLDMSFLQFDETWEHILFDGGIPIAASGGICYSFYRQMKTAREKHEASGYITDQGLRLTGRTDVFINETVTRTKVAMDKPID